MRGCKHLAAVGYVLSILALFCAPPAHSQFTQPALCPPVASPGMIAYPRGIIPYDDGLNSGNFVVSTLEYARQGGLSPYAVYTPYPKPPVDIVDPYKSWTLAAIYARCYYYYSPRPWRHGEREHRPGVRRVRADPHGFRSRLHGRLRRSGTGRDRGRWDREGSGTVGPARTSVST